MTDQISSLIRDIRKQLRLAMNGVVSTSMREKGTVYKLNFGVSLPKIKEIARAYPKDPALAEALWLEDVRELKILATLLHPTELFTSEQAERWASMVTQQEIAELYCAHLLQYVAYAEKLAIEWLSRSEEFIRVLGFLLLARLCMQGRTLSAAHVDILLSEAKKELDLGISRIQQAALLSLKRYGRQNNSQAQTVLTHLSDYPHSGSPEKEEFYEDLKFEFDYYQ